MNTRGMERFSAIYEIEADEGLGLIAVVPRGQERSVVKALGLGRNVTADRQIRRPKEPALNPFRHGKRN